MTGSLYDLRIQLGLSKSEVADRAGVRYGVVHGAEMGSRPHAPHQQALVLFFSRELDRIVTATELFGPPAPTLSVVPDPEEAA